MNFQWKKNGVAISGATSTSYKIPAVTTADNGARYTVTVSNGMGTTTSSTAVLTVNANSSATAYGFSEGSGSVTSDASGNGNTGSLVGASWTAGHNGSALSFNGISSYVEAANSNSLNPGTAATFSAWVNVVAANADISSVINKWSQTADDEYLFGLDPSNRLTFAWQTTGGNTWGQPSYNLVSGNAQVPLNTWAYVTVVRNGPSISFYINGNLDAAFSAAADSNPFRNGANALRVGGQNRGSVTRFLNGKIDEVRMYNQALSQAQIQADMNSPIGSGSPVVVTPSITTPPGSRTVTVGQTASFSVSATGSGPLSYQWQKNGAAISGATSASYTTPATTSADNGAKFAVVVKNSVGSATSNAATLTVSASTSTYLLNASPTSLSFGNVSTSSSNLQAITLKNSGNSNVSISNVSVSGAGFNVSGVSTGTTLTPGQSVTLNVTFAPSSTGSVTGRVSVSSNATNSPGTINLSGTGIAQHTVSLSWNDNTPALTGFNVYRSATSGSGYVKINSSLLSGMTYIDSNVSSGTTYFYVTTAVDSSGNESAYSNQASAAIP